MIMRFLKYFGNLITHLMVEYKENHAMNPAAINMISKFINAHCSNSLKYFEINNHHKTFFNEMMKPFKSVENLFVQRRFENLASSTLTFSELIPAVRHLSVNNVQVANRSFIDQTFLNLMNLDFSPVNFEESDVETFLQNNPQIQCLKMKYCNRKHLKVVSKKLLILDHLEIESCDASVINDAEEQIVFKSVKNFTTRISKNFTSILMTNLPDGWTWYKNRHI